MLKFIPILFLLFLIPNTSNAEIPCTIESKFKFQFTGTSLSITNFSTDPVTIDSWTYTLTKISGPSIGPPLIQSGSVPHGVNATISPLWNWNITSGLEIGATYTLCLEVVDNSTFWPCTASYCEILVVPSCNVDAQYSFSAVNSTTVTVQNLSSNPIDIDSWTFTLTGPGGISTISGSVPSNTNATISPTWNATFSNLIPGAIYAFCLEVVDEDFKDCSSLSCIRHFVVPNNTQKRSSTFADPIDDFEAKLYPNPATSNNSVQLSFIAKKGEATIIVTDLQGKVMSQQIHNSSTEGRTELEISTKDLSNGAYFLTISQNGQRITKKLIIN